MQAVKRKAFKALTVDRGEEVRKAIAQCKQKVIFALPANGTS